MSSKRRKQNISRASNPPASALRGTAASKPPRPALSRRRKWLFRLTAVIIAPLLFFTVLEAGLRLGGYGYPTSFYIGPDARGTYATNPQFGWRFFPPALVRSLVSSSLSAKPTGAIRVFVLGSSAAQGVPNPAFSFGRILEVMLRDRYPGVKFEVVNAAMTAINSHVTREIARDCAAFQPDLFVVYMGNNEVIGPYGPGTVFQQWSPSLKFIRANIWVKSTRTGQLLDAAMRYFHSTKGSDAWRGMEMFMGNQVAADDPRLAAVYDNFRRNLSDICGIARRTGAAVILSTVAVNLKDCPPLASRHRSDLSAEDLAKWKTIYESGIELEAKEQWPEANVKFEAAAGIDDRFADLQFRMGRCLLASNQYKEARKCFILARDLDALRFRADSRINAAIREAAAEQAASGVRLADAEQALTASDLAAGGIPGGEMFYEHVHFNFDGNYLLARTVLEQVDAALPQLAASRKQGPVLTRRQCAESLAFTLWDEYQLAKLMAEMTARPPFTHQLDHAARLDSARERADKLGNLASTPEAQREVFRIYEAALEKTPDDWRLHHRFGKLLLVRGEFEIAADHLRLAAKKNPLEPALYIDLGNAEKQCGRINEAIASFYKTLELDPGSATAYNDLALALVSCGRTEEALVYYRRSLEIDAGSALGHFNLAMALNRCRRIDEAIAQFEKVLEIDPQFVMAHYNLGVILANSGRTEEAAKHAQQALKIETGNASVHDNLGIALAGNGQIDQAIDQYQKALKIDPQFAMAHYNLGVALYDRGKIDDAIAHYQKALEINPRNALAYYNLGKALANRGRTDEAIDNFQRALKIKPSFTDARLDLQAALAERDRGSGRRNP